MKHILFVILLLNMLPAMAQESNVQKYTPSVLLGKGQWESNTFYNLYTQTSIRDRNGDKVVLGQRQTFLNAMYQFTYGASRSARFNIGLDVFVTKSLYDGQKGSPLKVFTSDKGDFSRVAVTGIGPRIRYVPLPSIEGFSIQSTFLFPVAKNLEQPAFTGHNRYTWFTQLFYDLKLNSKWRLFLESDVLYRIKRESEDVNFLRLPVSAFLSYFPNSKSSFFIFSQHSPRFERLSNEVDEQFGLSKTFTQLGAGVKYQVKPKLGIELSYGNFVGSREDGAGYTVNLGFRYIK